MLFTISLCDCPDLANYDFACPGSITDELLVLLRNMLCTRARKRASEFGSGKGGHSSEQWSLTLMTLELLGIMNRLIIPEMPTLSSRTLLGERNRASFGAIV
jgi:hypothetical protein